MRSNYYCIYCFSMVDNKLIILIKEMGYSIINIENTFSDGRFTQIEFRDEINSSHIACFEKGKLLTII